MKVLTFDIEEWYHILDNDSTKTEKQWTNFESRIHQNMDRILGMLESKNQKATFFCLGWIAERYPEVIQEIDKLGHEIGSHSHLHQLVYEQRPDDFKTDLKRSINCIEDIIGKKVTAYRSPGFSLKRTCLWAFDIMAELGIEVDCSIFPAARAHGGISEFEIKKPFILRSNGYQIKEFPMSVFQVRGLKFVFSGGGYFRLLPYQVIQKLVNREDYVMTYFHPRDFDKLQPIIKELPLIRKFKSYYGLSSAFKKLEKMIDEFEFTSLQKASEKYNWAESDLIEL